MEYKEWKSFEEEYPKKNCGLLIKIVSTDQSEYDTIDRLYFGYVFPDSYYIYLIAEIYNNKVATMGWKVLKDFDKKEVFWFYDSFLTSKS